MEPTTSAMVTAIILGQVRAVLTGVAGYLITAGALQSNQQEAFIQIASGIVMYVVGALWSAYQKKGIAGILKDLESLRGHVQNIPYTTDTPTPTAVAKINTAISVAKDAAGTSAVIVMAILILLLPTVTYAAATMPAKPKMVKVAATVFKRPAEVKTALTTVQLPSIDALWKQIVGVATVDITYAKAMADNVGSAGSKLRSACYGAILIAADQANPATLKDSNGNIITKPSPALFTLLEQVAEVAESFQPTSPLVVGCVPAANALNMSIGQFISMAATGAASLSMLGIALP